jgi:ribosomal protein S18 acetylase RimI-like enzyme
MTFSREVAPGTACVRCHRKGMGRAMMARAEEAFAAIGCVKVNLQTRSENAQVVAFNEAIGYFAEDRVSIGKRSES